MKTLKLNNQPLPILGLGTWKSAPGDVYQAVKEALKIGYRHIDCAAIYGNEKEIGQAIKESIDEKIVSRNELWVTSKLWNNNHGEENVVPAIKQTLSDLQLDYLDLYLIHWPIAQKQSVVGASKAEHFISLNDLPIENTWKGMEQTVKLDLAKSIGVCNFSTKKLTALLQTSTIKPVINQVELHPYFQQNDLVEFCHTNNIEVMAYSPLGSSDRPASLKDKGEPILLQDPIINDIAKEIGASPAQVIISWIIHRGISVIPKSVNPNRLRQNFKAADITLTDHQLELIQSINKNRRYVDGKLWKVHNSPYTIENLWDE